MMRSNLFVDFFFPKLWVPFFLTGLQPCPDVHFASATVVYRHENNKHRTESHDSVVKGFGSLYFGDMWSKKRKYIPTKAQRKKEKEHQLLSTSYCLAWIESHKTAKKSFKVSLFHWKWLTEKYFQHFRMFVSRKISDQRKTFFWLTENQVIFL